MKNQELKQITHSDISNVFFMDTLLISKFSSLTNAYIFTEEH